MEADDTQATETEDVREETGGETTESSADEVLTDREDGGPTADPDAEGEATGEATGTRPTEGFDAHE